MMSGRWLKMAKSAKNLPRCVVKNLDYYLELESEDPEKYGKLIHDICVRWGI